MDHSVFALEVCMRLEPGSVLRHVLHQAIAGYDPGLSLHQKWQQYSYAAQHLLSEIQLVERGCWDYFDDDQKARRDYDMWCNGMLTEEGARKTPSASADPYRSEPRYLTFTMALLIVQGSPTDRMLAQACNIPQDRLWHRATFAHILRSVGAISFASVKSDVLYLIPRDEGWGLTAHDLSEKKFEYLRTVV